MSVIKDIEGRRFVILTGKGGAGKTTVMAALALVLASQRKRVLCVMCQARDRLSTLLEGQPVGDEIVELRPNIMAVNIDPVAALREYGAMVLRIRALYKAVFDSPLVWSLFRATPGLYEWAMLGKAWFHTTEVLPGGDPRFDVVLFDAPSTGHALGMLRGPKTIMEAAPPGLLHREAKKAWMMFTDPVQTGVVLVTLPEEMPVTETLELFHALDGELGLPVAQVIVNKVIPPVLSPKEREALLAFPESELARAGNEALTIGVRRAMRETVQQCALVRLREEFAAETRGSHGKVPLSYLPGRVEGVQTLASVRELSLRLA